MYVLCVYVEIYIRIYNYIILLLLNLVFLVILFQAILSQEKRSEYESGIEFQDKFQGIYEV